MSAQGDEILRRQKLRWDLLHFLYDDRQRTSSGNTQNVPAHVAGKVIGVSDKAELEGLYTYLADAGLLNLIGFGPVLEITKAGVDEVEEALTHPDEKTEHFPPVNVIRR